MQNYWSSQRKKRELELVRLFIKDLNDDFDVRLEKSFGLFVEYKKIPVLKLLLKSRTWTLEYCIEQNRFDCHVIEFDYASQGFWWLVEWFLFYSLSVWGFGNENMYFCNDTPRI